MVAKAGNLGELAAHTRFPTISSSPQVVASEKGGDTKAIVHAVAGLFLPGMRCPQGITFLCIARLCVVQSVALKGVVIATVNFPAGHPTRMLFTTHGWPWGSTAPRSPHWVLLGATRGSLWKVCRRQPPALLDASSTTWLCHLAVPTVISVIFGWIRSM